MRTLVFLLTSAAAWLGTSGLQASVLDYGDWTQGIVPKHSYAPLVPELSRARWGVGNGGDSLRLNMAKARGFASMMVSKTTPRALRGADEDIQKFMTIHGDALAGDILASPHVWLDDARPTCAWTTMPEGPDPAPETILFSYPTCASRIQSYLDATLLLIHESAHHFHQGEDFADRLALAIVSAWQDGALQWLPVPADGSPSARMGHGAAYDAATNQVFVFGGQDADGKVLPTGARYDVANDSWLPAVSAGTFQRYQPAMVAVDGKVFVWGGFGKTPSGGINWQHSGAIYDMRANSWRFVDAPYQGAQAFHLDTSPVQTVVAVGNKVFVRGGMTRSGRPIGGIYDMKTGDWSLPNMVGAPQRLAGHTAILTDGVTGFLDAKGNVVNGTGVLVWGGFVGANISDRTATDTGAYYHVASNTWYPLNTKGAPSARSEHGAAWMGGSMLVYSGAATHRATDNRVLHATGGIYDLATDTWTNFTSQIGAERTGHTMVWNGKEVLIMGGKSRNLKTYYSDVVAYDPENQSWRSISGKQAPSIRWQHTAVWTGAHMMVWGGGLGYYTDPTANGGLFYP